MYAYKHKPTKTWVFFKKGRGSDVYICLALKCDATVSEDKESLKKLLINASFNGVEEYGKDNLLEFKLEKITK